MGTIELCNYSHNRRYRITCLINIGLAIHNKKLTKLNTIKKNIEKIRYNAIHFSSKRNILPQDNQGRSLIWRLTDEMVKEKNKPNKRSI